MTPCVRAQVFARFSASPVSGAAPLEVAFDAGGSISVGDITNCFWDFGDGTTTNVTGEVPFEVSHIYQGVGTFAVTLVASGPAGSGTNTQVNLITTSLVPPLANFSANFRNGAPPLEVFFNSSSTGSITNYFWDFGDGATTNGPDGFSDHTYQGTGTFTVTLIASGPVGSATNTQVNLITTGFITANFSASPTNGVAPLEVAFDGFSSTGSITNYFWDFGDGTTSNETDSFLGHTYQVGGTFTVPLVVSGPAGSGTNTQVNLITTSLLPPVANFSASPTNDVAPLDVEFDGLSSTGSITNYFWDFGDGTTTSGQGGFLDHPYPGAGTFTVTLVVRGPAGSATNTKVNLITSSLVPPAASFSASHTNGAPPLQVFFNSTSTGSITNYFWDFGDGTTTSGTDGGPAHTYQGAGAHTVTLIVSGPAGSATNTQVNLITTSFVAPVASFSASPTNGAPPLNVFFDSSSTGSITNYFWDFGDGTTSNEPDGFLGHTYQGTGTFTVTLIASGPVGSSTNTQANLITTSLASFTASPTSGVAPLSVFFSADASTTNITNYFWDFGDGTTTNGDNSDPIHEYEVVGTYTVTLIVSGPAVSATNTQVNLINVMLGPVVNSYQNSASGKWEDGPNWSLTVPPNSTQDQTEITNAVTKTVTIDSTTSGGFPSTMTISNLDISGGGRFGSMPDAETNTLAVSNAGTNAPLNILGGLTLDSPGAALIVSNSIVQVRSEFQVGGTITIQSGGVVMGTALNIGYSGVQSPGVIWVVGGSLAITNGTVAIGGELVNTEGQLTLSNGTIQAGDVVLGGSGNDGGDGGILSIAGGAMTLSGGLRIGGGGRAGGGG